MRPRTSIVMPVYNTGDRVLRSIRSVLDQTDPDWELLVMIDASPDDASQVVAGFLAEHPDERVRVFDNSVNRGVSAVRNQALDAARGQWVSFLDSDDRYRPNFLATMHAFLEDTDAQVAVCGHTLVEPSGAERDRFRAKAGVYSGEAAARGLLADRMTPYVWDKMIAAEVAEGLRFPENIHRAEDAVFSLGAYAAAHRVVVVPSSLYLYTVDPGSATWGKVTPVEESARLVHALRTQAGDAATSVEGRRAMATSSVLTYLNNAQQAMVAKRPDDAVVRDCGRRIAWRQLGQTLRVRPEYAAAGTVLKTAPGLYRSLYRSYVKRQYGL